MNTISINRIDVTLIEPRMKHPTIFAKFDELREGDSLVIINDHDPKPLYYQLLGERGNIFSWEYLITGPFMWEVEIKKTENAKAEATIGELVAKDYRKAEVFKKYKIDFCCGGKKTLTQACKESAISIESVKEDLKNLNQNNAIASQNYYDWDVDFLIDYIIKSHHQYIKNAIPTILEYTEKVARVHGEAHLEVKAIDELFKKASEELYSHLNKEENILFPYIKKIFQSQNQGQESPVEYVKTPIKVMEQEHDIVGNIFKTIKELSNDYTPPADACTSFKLVYKKLKEFEDDLHQHIHLENNILFPKSIEIEYNLLNN